MFVILHLTDRNHARKIYGTGPTFSFNSIIIPCNVTVASVPILYMELFYFIVHIYF